MLNLQATPTEPAPLPLFTDDSAIRRVHREGVLLLGGGRAVLLQLAHPLVARGVAEHSDYAEQRWRRLLRTLRPMYAIAFGDTQQMVQAAGGVNRMHKAVRGEDYRALDPSLLLWVLATLIDTSVELHRRFLRPLSEAECEAYYADMCRVGGLLSIPAHRLPPDYAAFRVYFDAQLAELHVSVEAMEISRNLLRLTPANAAFTLPLRWLTAGLLPEPLRREYCLGWSRRSERAFAVIGAVTRAVLPRVPLRVRRTPVFLMPPRPKARQPVH